MNSEEAAVRSEQHKITTWCLKYFLRFQLNHFHTLLCLEILNVWDAESKMVSDSCFRWHGSSVWWVSAFNATLRFQNKCLIVPFVVHLRSDTRLWDQTRLHLSVNWTKTSTLFPNFQIAGANVCSYPNLVRPESSSSKNKTRSSTN